MISKAADVGMPPFVEQTIVLRRLFLLYAQKNRPHKDDGLFHSAPQPTVNNNRGQYTSKPEQIDFAVVQQVLRRTCESTSKPC